jgi:hypothetical protein
VVATHPESPCPRCGIILSRVLNITSGITGDRMDSPPPTAGDAGICGECGYVFMYAPDGQARRPEPDEVAKLLTDPDLIRGLDLVARLRDPDGESSGGGGG